MGWNQWNGDRMISNVDNATAKGLLKAGEAIGMISDQQVPHDEGVLQGSKTIKANPQNKLEVAISYGGGDGTGHPVVPYAKKWHFTDANFQKGRKSYYLQDPVFNDGSALVMKHVGQEVGNVIKGANVDVFINEGD